MKYPSGNNRKNIFFSLAVMMSLTAFSPHNYSKNCIGTWQYLGIYIKDSSIALISPSDTMVLNKNGTFRYDIASLNKHSFGNWKYVKKKGKQAAGLKFTYEPDKNVRTFYFCYVNANELCIFEGDVQFRYKRIK